MTELMKASNQWMSRPDDQRFTSLHELAAAAGASRARSRSTAVSVRHLHAGPSADDPRHGLDVSIDGYETSLPTHWSFGQLAGLAKAPAGYLRTLPAPIAADAINYGLRFLREAEDVKLLVDHGEQGSMPQLRAATGPRYGRVWNADIADALVKRFGDGVTGDWRVPGTFGKPLDEVTKRNTTIFGSDRDMFVFLADEQNRVSMRDRRNGQPGSLAKGFFVWNSEVGSQSIGAAFFLFDYVCSNRIVWGATEYKEIRLRHTSSAPDRWLEEITPVLTEYANAAAGPVEQVIAQAQRRKVDDDLDAFLAKRFTKPVATAVKAAHEREEGRPIETVWDAVTGVTAHAKTLTHQDARVSLEREGGKLLDLVAA